MKIESRSFGGLNNSGRSASGPLENVTTIGGGLLCNSAKKDGSLLSKIQRTGGRLFGNLLWTDRGHFRNSSMDKPLLVKPKH